VSVVNDGDGCGHDPGIAATAAPEPFSPEKHAQILAGAAQVFARDGYEGASMSHIARAAGVSKGTLYNYFDSKAALFAAYVQQQCREKLLFLMGDSILSLPPAEALSGIARRMLQMLMSPSGLTIYRVVISEAAKFPELARAFYEAGPARATGLLADWLAEETRRGRLAVADPQLAAEQFFALAQTRLYLLRKLHMIEAPAPEEIERIVAASVHMFLGTYGAGESVKDCAGALPSPGMDP
jgi:AcrR family transcriptional regulator